MEDGERPAGIFRHLRPCHVFLIPYCVPENRVDQSRRGRTALPCDADGLVDRSEGGDPVGEQKLIEGRSKNVPGRRFQRRFLSPVETTNDPVQAAPHPERSVDEFGEELPVGEIRYFRAGQHGIQQRFGVGAVPVDPVQNIDRHTPNRLFPFGSHPRIRSPRICPGKTEQPRRKSATLIRFFPSSCTSFSSR